MSSIYWVNPALSFKGDRVAFEKECRRKSSTAATMSRSYPVATKTYYMTKTYYI